MKKSLTIIAAFLFSISAFSQIPNAGFESWTTVGGYTTPDGWDNMNSMTASMSVYTCSRAGTPGGYYLHLTSQTVPGMGVMPGIATCGMLDMSQMSAPSPATGFAFAQRPQALTGKWQYMASGLDMGYISVMLTRWNPSMMKRDTIASYSQDLIGMAMNWTDFTAPLTYTSQLFPDTAFITLSASGATPVANSYLYVDTLQFTGSVAGTNGINENAAVSNISIFPNPSSDIVRIHFDASQNTSSNIQLISAEGAIVKEVMGIETKEYNMNIAGLAKGVYLIRVSSAQGTVSKHISIL